jgi:hypothetical protein
LSASAQTTSEIVPAVFKARHAEACAIVDRVCASVLGDRFGAEYAAAARSALATLCRKRPSPMASGPVAVWACAVVVAIYRANRHFAPESAPSPSPPSICEVFGVEFTRVEGKAVEAGKILGIDTVRHDWTLPSFRLANPMLWLVKAGDRTVDVRTAPRRIQEEAWRKGLIPFVPDDGGRRSPEWLSLYAEYDRLRIAAGTHMTALARRAVADGLVDPVARRMGIMGDDGFVYGSLPETEFGLLAPAFDIALFAVGADGMNMVQRRLATNPSAAGDADLLRALGSARFSIFRHLDRHEQAGVWLEDVVDGGRIWLLDRKLEATAARGACIGTRVFKASEFWLSCGVKVDVELAPGDPAAAVDLAAAAAASHDGLAEDLYRAHFGHKGF